MTVDRERTLQVAQSYLDAQKFDRALEEFQKIIHADPNDTRVLLKIGDLQVRARDYVAAITTYERVADFYARQGFALKAIAVYKQIRELVQKHAAGRADNYAYIVDRLTSLYSDLGLVQEALTTLDEEANWQRSRDREDGAVALYRRMAELSAQNPLPHLRLAEGLCRLGQVDEAITSFWTAAELLLNADRADDALRVIERMLHFKQDASIAKAAARIYLDKGTQTEGMQALSRLQICFQADPKDIETLQLLAQAFEVIGQSSKAFEVRKEIVRLAHEQGESEIFAATLVELQHQAPEDEQVRALTQLPPPDRTSSGNVRPSSDAPVPSIPRAPARPRINSAPDHVATRSTQELETIEELEFLDDSGVEVELDAEAGSTRQGSLPPAAYDSGAPDRTSDAPLSLQRLQGLQPQGSSEPAPASSRAPRGDTTAPPSSRHGREPTSTRGNIGDVDPQLHTRRALTDANAFRSLRLLDKAIETVQVALEFDPQSIPLRESLRDLYVERGDRDAAIEEMLTMAAIYVEYDRHDHAQTVLLNVLEATPDHPVALRTLAQLNRQATSSMPPPASIPPSQGPLPRFEAKAAEEEGGSVEDTLEEAEFFVSRGLLEDALLILKDQLDRTPGHPLLLENIREVQEELAAAGQPISSRSSQAPLEFEIPSQGSPPSSQLGPRSAPPSSAAPSSSAPTSTAAPISSAATSGVSTGSVPPSSTVGAPGSQRPTHPANGTDESFDLKAQLSELERVVRESQRPPAPGKKKKATVSVDKVFERFKTRVRGQVSDHDSSTHYDLGVAYKEMKLFGDAIEELKLAARDPSLECNCYSMIGLIYAEQEKWEDAGKAYTRALSSVKKTVAQEGNLYYDLGHVHEKLGLFEQASYYFQQVLRRDSGFRDTRERVAALRQRAQNVTKTSTSGDDELDRAFEELLGD